MDDIRRRDWKAFLVEASSFRTISAVGMTVLVTWLFLSNPFARDNPIAYAAGSLAMAWIFYSAFLRSIPKRFHHERFRYLWKECRQRRDKLGEALGKLRRSRIADLHELERTISTTMPDIYRALRRADMALREIHQSESLNNPKLLAGERLVNDPQAQELYKVADRNVAEYTQQYKLAIAGVERAEAQCVVFSTTLDTLRIRMLNYTLAGRSPENETKEFLNIVAEAKMQFSAIDKALDEIELMPFTQTIHTLPGETVGPRQELSQAPPPVPPITNGNEDQTVEP
ncbi:MAG: hypothetical protein JSS71_05910 [Armatimonadetes bacterium]|nr:hypothetical protein [Armatimonadota bacterium]MBX3108918.1 hypothetical protein [Fimbriimonadaceae bacterium]